MPNLQTGEVIRENHYWLENHYFCFVIFGDTCGAKVTHFTFKLLNYIASHTSFMRYKSV